MHTTVVLKPYFAPRIHASKKKRAAIIYPSSITFLTISILFSTTPSNHSQHPFEHFRPRRRIPSKNVLDVYRYSFECFFFSSSRFSARLFPQRYRQPTTRCRATSLFTVLHRHSCSMQWGEKRDTVDDYWSTSQY